MTAPASPAAQLRRSRVQMFLVGVLFFIPFVLAYLLYFQFPELQPGGRTNNGRLIDPARPLPALDLAQADGSAAPADLFKGKWTLLQLGAADCDAACVKHLYMSRQVRTRLDRDARRVQRVYVAPDAAALSPVRAALATQHPDLLWLVDRGGPGHRLADFLQPRAPDTIYLIDPLGNWMMEYPQLQDSQDYAKSTAYMSDLYKDMKKLLKLSQID